MMTREDLMRELELLPVWQLRAPSPAKELPPAEPIFEQMQTKSDELPIESPEEQAVVQQEIPEDVNLVALSPSLVEELTAEPTVTIEQTFSYISSEDGHWLFVMPSTVLTSEEKQLFQNICKALRIRTKQPEISSSILSADIQAKLLFVFGEATARALTKMTEPLTSLRGKQLQLDKICLIASYDLAHLLQNPTDKAKTWQDLCLGLQVLRSLNAIDV